MSVLDEVKAERARQDDRWGEQNHPNGTNFSEFVERAEYAKAVCDAYFRHGKGTWRHILEEEFWEVASETDPKKLRAELIQVAAVAVAWVEAIDRKRGA